MIGDYSVKHSCNPFRKREKKIEAEIKKAAKMGNKEACKILAKQLIQVRKQKTRTYQASAQISSIGSKQKIMHANQKVIFFSKFD